MSLIDLSDQFVMPGWLMPRAYPGNLKISRRLAFGFFGQSHPLGPAIFRSGSTMDSALRDARRTGSGYGQLALRDSIGRSPRAANGLGRLIHFGEWRPWRRGFSRARSGDAAANIGHG
jgi:hypothetical protein